MPAYHSAFNDPKTPLLCNAAFLPIKTTVKGPAPPAGRDDVDIIDEAIGFFKANVFFRTFDIKGPGDRILIYLTLYIQQCLSRLEKAKNRGEADRLLNTLALEKFPTPADSSFALPGIYTCSPGEEEKFRQYYTQLRLEVGLRMVALVFKDDQPNKWWMCFSKRKFLNKNL
uniref:Actin-related protein 2/3 complex subunit 3 n=1 Tax=Collodictyon triciliatum TaxID=190325 RepID=H8ZWP5_9EUKA